MLLVVVTIVFCGLTFVIITCVTATVDTATHTFSHKNLLRVGNQKKKKKVH